MLVGGDTIVVAGSERNMRQADGGNIFRIRDRNAFELGMEAFWSKNDTTVSNNRSVSLWLNDIIFSKGLKEKCIRAKCD